MCHIQEEQNPIVNTVFHWPLMLKQQVPCQTLGLSTPKKEMLKTSCPQSAPKSEVKIQTVWTQKIPGRGESLGRSARAAGDAGVP